MDIGVSFLVGGGSSNSGKDVWRPEHVAWAGQGAMGLILEEANCENNHASMVFSSTTSTFSVHWLARRWCGLGAVQGLRKRTP
jgi:hypothetical protein